MISNDLYWSPQVECVTYKANRVHGLLTRNVKEYPQELREIEYTSVVWDNHLKGHDNN